MVAGRARGKATTPRWTRRVRWRYLFPVISRSATTALPVLSPPRRATLAAAAGRIVPHAFEVPARGEALVNAIAETIARLPAPKRADLEAALDLLGSRWAILATGIHPVPFSVLGAAEQDRLLDRWIRSRVAVMRSVVQAVRRLVLLTEYATPEAQTELGYHGAYFTRGPQFAWEGPLEGAHSDDDPVFRGARSAPIPAPRRNPWKPELPAADAVLKTEVLVIGSGAGGAVAAARLAEAGHRVMVLEEGEPLDAEDFTENEPLLRGRLYAERGLRATDDASVSMLQGATLGGGTTVNWMIMLRTPDWVLDEWTARHGAEGMTPRELAPVFDCIEREVHARTVTDDAHSPNNRTLIDGARKLGWSVHAARINAHDCLRSGFCGAGCRYGAKQSALVTFLPRAVAAGARIVTSARATRIEIMERGGAFPMKRVTVELTPRGESPRDNAPRTVTIEAPVVIVAAGAVGTPTLLQASGFGGDGVGRFLRLHPTSMVLGVHDREIWGATGIPLSAVCDEHLRHDANGYGFWIECPPAYPSIAAAAIQGFGAAHRATMLGYRSSASLIALVRDGADRDISNGDITALKNGRTRIRYRLGAADARHLTAAIAAAARIQLAAGAREVHTLHARPVILRSEADLAAIASRSVGPNEVALFSAHVNGTCRIGTDSANSGTDPHGERRGAPGVFVADGSLLPTALGVNPQETIMALSTIVAERIAARRRPG
jgi:choline dehydrogenase-like flavoprotein